MGALQPLLDRLAAIKSSFPTQQWTWDGRFDAVAATFASNVAEQARASAGHGLPDAWTPATLSQAPEPPRAMCKEAGGVRPGQLLLTGADVAGVPPFGLWWPWGGGATITLRIGLAGSEVTAEHLALLRAAFGVASAA
jgi:hypothetical protein